MYMITGSHQNMKHEIERENVVKQTLALPNNEGVTGWSVLVFLPQVWADASANAFSRGGTHIERCDGCRAVQAPDSTR